MWIPPLPPPWISWYELIVNVPHPDLMQVGKLSGNTNFSELFGSSKGSYWHCFPQGSPLVLSCLRLWLRTKQGTSKWQWHPLRHLPAVLLSALAQFRAKGLISVLPAWAPLHRGLMYNRSQATTDLKRIKCAWAASDLSGLYRQSGRKMVVPWMDWGYCFFPVVLVLSPTVHRKCLFLYHMWLKKSIPSATENRCLFFLFVNLLAAAKIPCRAKSIL